MNRAIDTSCPPAILNDWRDLLGLLGSFRSAVTLDAIQDSFLTPGVTRLSQSGLFLILLLPLLGQVDICFFLSSEVPPSAALPHGERHLELQVTALVKGLQTRPPLF